MKNSSKKLLGNISILSLFLLSSLIILQTYSSSSIHLLFFIFFLKITFVVCLCSFKKLPVDPREPIFILLIIDAIFFGSIYFVLYLFFGETKIMMLPRYNPDKLIFSFCINTIGWLSFVIGYFLRMSYKNKSPLFINKKLLIRIRRSLPLSQENYIASYRKIEIVILVWLSFSLFINSILFIAKNALRGSGNLPESNAFLLSLLGNLDILLVSLTTLVAAKINNNNPKLHLRSILLLITIISIITGAKLLTSTSKEEVIIPIVISIFTWFLRTKKFPKATLIVFAIIYIIFAPVNALLRNDAQVLIKGNIEFSDYVRVGASLLELIAKNENFLSNLFAETIARLDLVGISSTLIDAVDREIIPTTEGTSFLPFIYIFLPRILFPFKPKNSELYNPNYLGRITDVITSDNLTTSIAFGPYAELYLNFKIPAVILGMLLLGYLFRSFYELVVQKTEFSDLSITALSFPLYSFFRSYTSSFSALAGIIPSAIVSLLSVIIISFLIPTYKDEKR